MTAAKTKPVIGLVGGVGAGKSLVAQELAKLGCAVVDADRIGHRLLLDGQIREKLVSRWGAGIVAPDGGVSRSAVGEIVFENPQELAFLNGVLHPLIRKEMIRQIDAAMADSGVKAVVLDAAVLMEASWDDLCTARVFVDAPEKDRLARVGAQRGWDRQNWRRIENSQISLYKKANGCEYRLDNSSDTSYLRDQVHRLFCQIVHAEDRSS